VFDPLRLLISFGLSLLMGGLGYQRGSLTMSGWLGAVVVGTALAGLGGWTWGMLVVVFFTTSSALSHWRRVAKTQLAGDKFAKGNQRDFAQTMANGGAVTGLALLYTAAPHPILFAAALGVLATVTADTWATEVGILSRHVPRLVTTGRPVAPGTSGGVTVLGFGATLAGASVIGLVASMALWWQGQPFVWALLAAVAGGVVGALADSLLGATRQQVNLCPQCGSETEQYIHRCGTLTQHLRGWHWLDNDWVNFLASLIGGATSVLCWALLTAA
jgi:uncharacterized protein (TIGR00297 family)